VRILFHAGVDLSRPGGLETHLIELARGLQARGHEVDILAHPDRMPGLRMVSSVEPSRYDILHHHGARWPSQLPVDARYVRTLHFCTAAKMARYVGMGRVQTLANLGNWRALAEERRSVRRGRVIAVAPVIVRDGARYYGLDAARAVVIPNGTTFGTPRESRAAIRHRHGIPPEAPVLLTIGRADFVKGFDLIGRAWPAVRSRRPDAVWVSVGGVSSRSEGHLVTGPVPHEEVVSWIAAADLGAFPSYYEGCGVAILEMLAGGLFVLAHDVGIVEVVVREGTNGRVVEPTVVAWRGALADALERRPRGVPLDRSYGWDRIAERTEAVYQEILSASGRAVERAERRERG
jgi:glycosyltransferase involved in cell wall biosynthesis